MMEAFVEVCLDEMMPSHLYVPPSGRYCLAVVEVFPDDKRVLVEYEGGTTRTPKGVWSSLVELFGNDTDQWIGKLFLADCLIGLWKPRHGEDSVHWKTTTHTKMAEMYCPVGGYTAKLHVSKVLGCPLE